MSDSGAHRSPASRRREERAHPKRVRRGVKLTLTDEQLAENWAAQRWLRITETTSAGDALREGIEYARAGQARSIEIDRGAVHAFVQGRADRAYRTSLVFERLSEDRWEAIVATMADQAVYAAKLLAGELPSNIEDLFAPVGEHLFPAGPEEVRTECTCREPQPWCKHAMCVAYLMAERLASEQFLIFQLRGMPPEELLDRLRQRRSLAGMGGAAPVYVPHIEGVSDFAAPALSEDPERFWRAGAELAEVHAPLAPPEISHPLLRRLGPSPFTESRFPLVGLLATCYDLVGEAALRVTEESGPEPDEAAGAPSGDSSEPDEWGGDASESLPAPPE